MSATKITSVNPGSTLKFSFTGRILGLIVDTTIIGTSLAAKRWPRVACQIDGGAWQTQQIPVSTRRIVLASGLSSGTHTAVVQFLAEDSAFSRWSPVVCLPIIGIGVEHGGSITPAAARSGKMIAYGDSISEGAWALGTSGDSTDYATYQSAKDDYLFAVADYFDCDLGMVAFGGTGWQNAYNGIPQLQLSWDSYFTATSRLSGGLLTPAPNWLLCNLGTNDVTIPSTTIKNWLGAVRTGAGASCKIALFVPFNGAQRTFITTEFNDYQTATPDALCKLIDLGSPSFATTDGTHPSVAGHATLAPLVITALRTAFGL